MSIYAILDALDEEAASYVEKSGDLQVEVVERLHLVVSLLIEGRLLVAEADVVWPQWWFVGTAFAHGYGLTGLVKLMADVLALAEDDPVGLTDADLVFLWSLRSLLEGYIDHRTSGKPGRYGKPAGLAEEQPDSVAPVCRRPKPPGSGRPLRR